ncbi:hypothetical protein [Sphingobacterium humi]|uniref:Uncharacterized protein n=1 Tax=Sphingobacterium humi TaxID=1796905 RepID=A0A6N8L0X0_9SPHI|nr:hypothetical protein [Sphingobacterium humi]MVZ62957.1 hypothetical protein [Sphingobacterium humi]
MRKINSYLLILSTLSILNIVGCSTKLQLDDDVRIQLAKQEKIKKLNELFELAFVDAPQAAQAYDQYVKEALFTPNQNFMVDNDIRMHATFTDLAIRLQQNFERVKSTVSSTSLFDIYKEKYENNLFNRSLLGEIPQQLRKGEKLLKFESRAASFAAFFDDKVASFRKAHSPVSEALGKEWAAEQVVYTPDFSYAAVVKYDFQFEAQGQLAINEFFPIPVFTMKGLSKVEEPTEFKEKLKALLREPVSYTFYGDKLLCWMSLAQDPTPGVNKFNREYCYEFTYSLKEGSLVLSNPHIMLYMHPLLYITGYGEPDYELNYFESLREPFYLMAK